MPYGEFAQRRGFLYETLEAAARVLGGGYLATPGDQRSRGLPAFVWTRFFNSIYPVRPSSAVVGFVQRESGGGSGVRDAAMRSFTRLHTCLPVLTAQGSVVFPDAPEKWQDIVIYPGNKKVKVIDTDNLTILNVVRQGYSKAWLSHEVALRANPSIPCVLPIGNHGDDWYSERLIVGRTMARMRRTERRRRDPAVMRVIREMGRPVRVETVREYCERLCDSVVGCARSLAGRLGSDDFALIIAASRALTRVCSQDASPVVIGFSHGDLQPGNIMFEDVTDRLFVLDWETYGERSALYDIATYYYGLRRLPLPSALRQVYTDECQLFGGLGLDAVSRTAIVCLEEIEWSLRELEVMPDGVGTRRITAADGQEGFWRDVLDVVGAT